MFGNEPSRWSDSLAGAERLRFTLNALTRDPLRLRRRRARVRDQGRRARPRRRASSPGSTRPGRRTAGTPIAFGHWSSLGLVDRADLLGIDTGCVWGDKLTAVRIEGARREFIQVAC